MPETLTPAGHWRDVDELLGRVDRELVHNEEVVRDLDRVLQEVPEYMRERARQYFGRPSRRDVEAVAQAQSISPRLRSML